MENQEERRQDTQKMQKSLDTQFGMLAEAVGNIKEDITEIKNDFKKLNEIYTSKMEFAPVKTIAFGLVGMLLLGILSAVIKLVVK